MSIRLIATWAASALFLTAALPQNVFAAGKTVVVAQAIDLSGPNGSIGRDYVTGITTYFDSVNAKGGVNGRKIEYVVRDDRGVPAQAAAHVTSLLREHQADIVLGGIGAEATAAIVAAPAFAQSRQALFAPLADSAATRHARVLYWRPSMESEFSFLLNYFEKLGIKDIGIALQQSPQYARAFQFVSAEMRLRKLNLAGVAKIDASPALLQEEARRLSKSGAKLVITIGDTFGSAQFLRAFRAHDASTFVAGTSLINLTTLGEIAGARATEWTVFSQVVPNPGSAVSPLQAEHIKMMKRFRDEPVSALTLEGFAVAKTLVQMLRVDGTGQVSLAGHGTAKNGTDLGGMIVAHPERGHNLSRYVDIALFKRGALMY